MGFTSPRLHGLRRRALGVLGLLGLAGSPPQGELHGVV